MRINGFLPFICEDVLLKFSFQCSITMIHNCDVINLYITKSIQKTFARPNSQVTQEKFISVVILASVCQTTDVQCIHFYRNLSEGQEIDRRSNFFASRSLENYDWNSFFLRSYHSTGSYWDAQSLWIVYRLISHVIRSKTFFQFILS